MIDLSLDVDIRHAIHHGSLREESIGQVGAVQEDETGGYT